MCFDVDSSPPIPVIRGAAVSHEDLTLAAADGNRFAAFGATPEEASRAGVVILPDVRGLYRFYEELALRFAERGMTAVALDYFGRTAGAQKRGDEFEYRPHVEQTTAQGIRADVAACIAYLRDRGATSIFTVGFCMGGRYSWLVAADEEGLAGAVGFYGRPGPAIERAGEIKAPILALQAGADQTITAEDNAAFEAALTEAGVDHEIVTYEGTPHSFFDRKQAEFQAASDDAWAKTLAFISANS
jgi:carboxymethylenebutenolidase